MARDFLDLETIPNPLFDEPVRSAIQLVRRMLLLRWSASSYLTTVAGNYGVPRPAIGFTDDDIFRACSQVLMADHKAITNSFHLLLEILLGPKEDLLYEVGADLTIGRPYVEIAPYGDYVEYTGLVGGPYTVDERIRMEHSVIEGGLPTDKKIFARVKLDDTANSRLYFYEQFSYPDGVDFFDGVPVIGLASGASAEVVGKSFRVNLERFPIYGTMIINPGLGTEESLRFVSTDPFLGRTRLIDRPQNQHAAGEKILVQGGCWDLIETRARRVVIRLLCDLLQAGKLPGNSYLHPGNVAVETDSESEVGLAMESGPAQTARLRERVDGDDVLLNSNLRLRDYVSENINILTYPLQILIDPDDEHIDDDGGLLLVTASSFDVINRQFVLTAPVPAGRRWPNGAKVLWYQTPTGEVVSAPAGAPRIIGRCRVPDPIGHWVIDAGGGNEEKVLITSTTYQIRRFQSCRLLPPPAAEEIFVDRAFDPVDPTLPHYAVITSYGLPVGPPIPVVQVDGRKLILTAPFPYTGIVSSGQEYSVELVHDPATLENILTVSRPLLISHAATESLTRYLGLSSLSSTWADHLPSAGWPPIAPSPLGQSEGKWPGPYVWDPSRKSPSNDTDPGGFVEMEIDRTDADDPRIYLVNTELTERFDPTTAPVLGTVVVDTIPQRIRKMFVLDASLLPTSVDIINWVYFNPNNPNPGHPPRLVVGGEGWFGRTPVYYWGKDPSVPPGEAAFIYISGVERVHLSGVQVATYHEQIPIEQPGSYTWGVDPTLEAENGEIILDHGSDLYEEVVYSSVAPRTLIRGFLEFERGFVPAYSHDPFRVSTTDPAETLGIKLVRADEAAVPRVDGYSFPFYLFGNAVLYRLKFVTDLVRAAGVELMIYDEDDNPINIDLFPSFSI